MRRSLGQRGSARVLFGALIIAGWARGAAADKTWNGSAADGKLGSAGNWTPSGVPGAGDVITFPATLSGSIAEDVDMLALAGIAFGSGVQSGVYHLAPIAGRSPVTLGSGGVTAAYTAGSALANDSVDCALELGATQAWTLTSPVDVGGDLALNGFNLTLNAAGGTSTIQGAISGTGALAKSGAGIVKLAGAANTFTGTTTVSGGTLQLAKSSGLAIPGNLAVNSGGVVTYLADDQIADGAYITFSGSKLALNGHSDTVGGLGTGGTLDLGAGGHLTITQAESGLQFMALVGDSASSIIYTDSLTFDLSGSGSGWTGTLVVDSGVVRSAQTVLFKVQVNGGGTAVLGGTMGALTVANKGSLLPGSQPVPGTLGCGDLTLAAGSLVQLRVLGASAASGNDEIFVTGSVTLGGTLDFALAYPPTLGDTITLIANDGSDAVSGTFAGLPEGAYFGSGSSHWRISYIGGDGNDVTVTATLPPPDMARFDDMSTPVANADLAMNVVVDAGVATDDLAAPSFDLSTTTNDLAAGGGGGTAMMPAANHGGCDFAVAAAPVAGAGWLLFLGGVLLGFRSITRAKQLRVRRRR